jgi:pSer/pThr/pTyr-binding forkhead associated (FHA) protein
MWILQDSNEPGPGTLTFRVLPGSIKTVGRAKRADFIVDAAMVSRLHARLTVSAEGRLEVLDLHSTNGTYVNGKRVAQAGLSDGDRLRIGEVELRVSRAGA